MGARYARGVADHALVSIIVPVFDMEQYLARCVQSLRAQSYPSLEIILVDDGSSDRSGIMCDEFAQADPRIRVIHQGNAGVSAARNAGSAEASGEFLTFVDPDDWVADDLVAHLVDLASDPVVDVAACQFVRVQDGEVAMARPADEIRRLDADAALQLYAGPTTSWMTSPCAKLIRAGLFDNVQFPVGRTYEDEFTTYRWVGAARQVVVSNAELYFYYVRPGSATQREPGPRQLLDRIEALTGQADFFAERGLPDVSGECRRRAFLMQRLLRARAAREGDRELVRGLRHQVRHSAAMLRRSSQPLSVRVIATVYALWPEPIDLIIRLNLSARLPGHGQRT